jgi:dehydrogenase/reductase SDR family member 1
MRKLQGKVALVTGASRGIGKGIALGLGEAGAAVYVTGRTVEEGTSVARLPGTIHQTAAEVTALGGRGIAIRCDHRKDDEVAAAFRQVMEESGRLDILVNNVWGGYERFTDGSPYTGDRPFWEQPLSLWDSMHRAGVRAHYIASVLAAPTMVAQRQGLIVNISSFAARMQTAEVAYGTAHAAIDRLAATLAHALREHGSAAVSLYPGLVRTESVMFHRQFFDLSNSESPQFVGRAVAALAADPNVMEKSGRWLVAAELAEEYGFTDIDGTQPRSLRQQLLGEVPVDNTTAGS